MISHRHQYSAGHHVHMAQRPEWPNWAKIYNFDWVTFFHSNNILNIQITERQNPYILQEPVPESGNEHKQSHDYHCRRKSHKSTKNVANDHFKWARFVALGLHRIGSEKDAKEFESRRSTSTDWARLALLKSAQ